MNNRDKINKLIYTICFGIVLFSASSALAATITWTGTSSSSWSNPSNWDANQVPTAADNVIVNSGAVPNQPIINEAVTVNSINLSAGQISISGTNSVTTFSLTQSGGVFDVGGGSFLAPFSMSISNGNFIVGNGSTTSQSFTLSGGTFNGGSGTLDFSTSFTVSGGTFTASTGNSFFGNSLTITGTGSFVPNGGTVVFNTGAGGSFNVVPNGVFTLDNVEINKPLDNVGLSVSSGDTLQVNGNLTLTNGRFSGGSLVGLGNISIASTFDGGAGTLLIDGNATRTVTIPASAAVPRLTINAPNTTINTSGTGTISLGTMQIQNVASITNGAADFNFNGSGTAPLTLSGGTFNGGSGSLTFGSTFTQTGGSFTVGNGNVSVGAAFVQSGGVFTGSGSTLDFQNNFTVSGGTFTASSGNTFMANGFSVNNAIFQPNGGTVIFTGTSNTNFNVLPDGVLALNNVEVNKSSDTAGLAVGSNDTMQVNGTFTLTNGRIIGAAGGTPQANGNLIVASTFDGGDGRMAFGGANVQSYTNNGGILPTGSWTVNKTGGTVNLLSDLDISNGTQNFTLTEGTITTGTNTVIAGTRNIFNTNGFIIGGLQRTYATAGSRQFFVGTANGFAPATINATAGTFGATTTFTVRANNGTLTGASPTNSLTRNWTLEPGTGGITTANLTFQYFETDLPGGANETGFSFLRRNGGMTTNQGFTTQNTTTNVFTLDGVTNFSDWTLGTLAPTAANVAVGGRVLTDEGSGIPRARLSLTDSFGNQRSAQTNPFGYYRFENVEVGQNYVISVASKSYEFANPTQVIFVSEQLTNVNFTAQNQIASKGIADISGRVTNTKERALPNLEIELSGGGLEKSLIVLTDENGNYLFENIGIGQTYILKINHKNLFFENKIIYLEEEISELNFMFDQ